MCLCMVNSLQKNGKQKRKFVVVGGCQKKASGVWCVVYCVQGEGHQGSATETITAYSVFSNPQYEATTFGALVLILCFFEQQNGAFEFHKESSIVNMFHVASLESLFNQNIAVVCMSF